MLHTERLVIRPYQLDDAEAAFEIYRHQEVARWLGSLPRAAETVQEVREAVVRWLERDDPDRPYLGFRAVTLAGTGELVGTVILTPLPDSTDIEIGWHFNPAHHGHGYATEAARAMADNGFAGGLDELFAVVRPGNEASVAVTRRLGMRPLGRTSDYYDAELDLFVLRPPA